MKQLILLRHAARIDKDRQDDKTLDTSSWLANYDPPLNLMMAKEQADAIQMSNILGMGQGASTGKDQTQVKVEVEGPGQNDILIHSSPYNRCIQTAELILDRLPKDATQDATAPKVKLRVDQALSEWLNFNFNLKFLPPNDNGISLLSNINQYLFQSSSPLERDMLWDTYKLGKAGEYGEEYEDFKKRCLVYLNSLLKFYENSNKTVILITHGAVISAFLQIILNKPFFTEIPLCVPIVFKKLGTQNLFQLISSNGIDFLKKYDGTIWKLKDLKLPVEYETNIFIDQGGDSEYSNSDNDNDNDDDDDEEEESEDEGISITFGNRNRNRSNTTGSLNNLIHTRRRKSLLPKQTSSVSNFTDLKKNFFFVEEHDPKEQDPVQENAVEKSSSEEDMALNFGGTGAGTGGDNHVSNVDSSCSSTLSSPEAIKLSEAKTNNTTTTTNGGYHHFHNQEEDKNYLQNILQAPAVVVVPETNNKANSQTHQNESNLYSINEEEDYWFGFNR